MFGLSSGMTMLLITCIAIACIFELINGFNDTSNSIVTVIYSRSLKPVQAVVLAGVMNFLGVFFGGIVVAMGIMKLLPNELLMSQTISQNVALIIAILLTAIIWNFSTWYFAIPCSSSHTLLGSIFGVGIAYNFLPEVGAVALNWAKVESVCMWLLLSPLLGFMLAWGFVALLKKTVKYKKLYQKSATFLDSFHNHPNKHPLKLFSRTERWSKRRRHDNDYSYCLGSGSLCLES